MNTTPNFFQAALNPESAQEGVDAHVDFLADVLDQNDPVATLDWVADFAVLTSRISDPESVDLRFEEVITQLEDHGYGEKNDSAPPATGAHSIIENTIGRMKDGLVPTGYERIFADKYKAENGIAAETVDIA